MKNNVSNIVLLGHMGSGKSTIGKSLAKKLSIDFVDSDYEIEKQNLIVYFLLLKFQSKIIMKYLYREVMYWLFQVNSSHNHRVE